MKCPDCGRELTAFTALDGSQPPAPRPGDPIICDPTRQRGGCGLVVTLGTDGRVRLYTDAERAAIEAHTRAKIAEARRVQ